MLTFNEGRACEAIVRHLEAREGYLRSDVQSPESVNHPDPVELSKLRPPYLAVASKWTLSALVGG
jgi:hypothetical protein